MSQTHGRQVMNVRIASDVNTMLNVLARHEKRTKIGEIAFLAERRLAELELLEEAGSNNNNSKKKVIDKSKAKVLAAEAITK